jgi:hypothetical protein
MGSAQILMELNLTQVTVDRLELKTASLIQLCMNFQIAITI